MYSFDIFLLIFEKKTKKNIFVFFIIICIRLDMFSAIFIIKLLFLSRYFKLFLEWSSLKIQSRKVVDSFAMPTRTYFSVNLMISRPLMFHTSKTNKNVSIFVIRQEQKNQHRYLIFFEIYFWRQSWKKKDTLAWLD